MFFGIRQRGLNQHATDTLTPVFGAYVHSPQLKGSGASRVAWGTNNRISK